MRVEYPTALQLPNIKTYLGRTNSEIHINAYYRTMMMMGLSDFVIYRAFFLTLVRRAADWFRTLEPGSIKNFQQLSSAFVRRFAVHKMQLRHFTHLNILRQKEGEPIALYLDKWTCELEKSNQLIIGQPLTLSTIC